MNTAGLNIIVGWDDSKVQKGVADLKALFSGGGLSVDSKGALSGINSTKTAIQELRKAVNAAKSELENYRSTTAMNDATAKQLQATYNGLKSQLDSVTKATKGGEDAYSRLARVANEATRHAQNLGATYGTTSEAFLVASKRANALTENLKTIDAATGRNFRNVGNYAGSINYLSTNVARIVGEMPNFAQSMRIGFMAISNNIQPLAESLALIKQKNIELAASGEKTISPLKAVGSALFSWNTLLMVGVTALTVYGPKLVEWIRGTEGAAEAQKKLNEKKKEFEQIESSAYKESARQIAQLNSLTSVLGSHNSTLDQKKGALKKLQDIYPSYFKNLDLDDVKTGKLSATVKELTGNLLASARARALEGKMAKLAEDEWDLTREHNKQRVELQKADAAKKNYKAVADGASNARLASEAYAMQKQKESNDVDDSYNTAFKNMARTASALRDNKKEQLDLNSSLIETQKELGKLSTQGTDTAKFLGKGGGGVAAAAKEAESEMSKLIKKLDDAKANRTFDLMGQSATSTGSYKQWRDAIIPKTEEQKLFDLPNLKAEMPQYLKDFFTATQKGIDENKKIVEDQIKSFNALIASQLQQGVSAIVESIGGALAGAKDPFAPIVSFIAQALKAFGAELIKIGIMKKSLDEAVKSLGISGVPAVIAGAAAIALGTYLQVQAQKKSQKRFAFADGGIVYGPTNALVGEYQGASTNPEVIAPLNKLKDILGNTGQQYVVLETRVSGQDLVLIQQRTNRYNSR